MPVKSMDKVLIYGTESLGDIISGFRRIKTDKDYLISGTKYKIYLFCKKYETVNLMIDFNTCKDIAFIHVTTKNNDCRGYLHYSRMDFPEYIDFKQPYFIDLLKKLPDGADIFLIECDGMIYIYFKSSNKCFRLYDSDIEKLFNISENNIKTDMSEFIRSLNKSDLNIEEVYIDRVGVGSRLLVRSKRND